MEIAASQKISRYLRIPHRVVTLPFFREFKKCSLIEQEAGQRQPRLNRLSDVWVPNRNGLFVNVAACFAEYFQAGLIVTGFNRDEAQEFPDNTTRFTRAVNGSLACSTLTKVRVKSYVAAYTKIEIYKLGMKLGVPFELTYSCYRGRKKMCGVCASCRRFLKSKQAYDA